ncbi:sulfite exporter TauE/SafE family protein [bacterium]|nr:MAG: sulfite exporter TauE/SafE family protein [bacterium]
MTNNPILSFFISGVLLGCGACLVSCGPILIFYFAGTRKDIKKSLISYGIFSFSRMLVYGLLGFLVFVIGQFATEKIFGHSRTYINIFSGIFIILIGFLMILGKRPGLGLINMLRNRLTGSDNAVVALLGIIIGLIPCGPLMAVLYYVGLFSKTWVDSLMYSLSFGLGTAISPMIILVIGTGIFSQYVKIPNSKVIDFICGLIIIILGLQLLFMAFI